jgi:siroheme synthase
MKNHTTIVLMGLSRAGEIVEAALKAGAKADMPAAIVSNASRPNQKRIITTLAGLPEAALGAERPGIIVFGDVVNLHSVLPQHEHLNEELCHDKTA